MLLRASAVLMSRTYTPCDGTHTASVSLMAPQSQGDVCLPYVDAPGMSNAAARLTFPRKVTGAFAGSAPRLPLNRRDPSFSMLSTSRSRHAYRVSLLSGGVSRVRSLSA